MPKLPDISLGARPTPSGSYQAPQFSSGVEGKGVMLGDILGKTSDILYKLYEKDESEKAKEAEERSRLQASYASSNLIKSIMDFEQEKKNDPAYEKHEQEYQEFTNKRVLELAQSIDDIKMRERFAADAQGTLISGLARIRSRAEDKQADSFNLQTQVMADQTKEIFLNAPDEETRTKAVDSLNEAIENNRFMKPSDKFEAKRKWLANTHEAWLNTLPPAEQVKVLETVVQKRKIVLNPAAPKDFSQSVDFLLSKIEGERLVQNDGGRGPSKYGIVGSQNGLTPEQVRNLTPDQAKEIYKQKYWDAIGAESLPENVRLLAFDTAVNFGVETAKGMLKQSGNDPAALLKLRRDMHRDIATEKPDTHGQYKKGWEGRDLLLETTVFKNVISKEDKDTFGIPTDRINVLLEKARKDVETERKAAEQKKILDMEADIDTKLQNEKTIRENIDSPEKTVMQKINEINKMEMLGQIRDKSAVEFRRYLESVEKLTAESEPNLEADIIQRVYDVAAISEENPKEFLRGIGNIQNEMLSYRADGRLSAQSENKLKKQITSLTSGKKSEAAKILGFSLSEARKTLGTLPPEYRLQATRELIQSVDFAGISPPSSDMSIKERKEYDANLKLLYKTKSLELVDKYKTGMRTKALETVEKVKKGKPVEEKKDHSSLWK